MSAFTQYLNAETQRLRLEGASLKAEGRGDEASFAQIRLNIHEICKTVLLALQKQPSALPLRERYLQKLDGFACSWSNAHQQALAHDDCCKAIIEQIKLETLSTIRVRYLEMGE